MKSKTRKIKCIECGRFFQIGDGENRQCGFCHQELKKKNDSYPISYTLPAQIKVKYERDIDKWRHL